MILRGGFKQRFSSALDTLEALYFFSHSLEGQASIDIGRFRLAADNLPRSAKAGLLDSIESNIRLLRDHYGAIARNSKFVQLFAEAKAEKLLYLPKELIDKHLFKHYEKVFTRWPNMRLHAYVPFDGANKKSLNWVFELEASHIGDATRHLEHAQKIFSTLAEGKEVPRQIRQSYRTSVSACIMSIFSFLESYVNGLAYDCFTTSHDELSLADHDLLSEWDSTKKRQRFVSFEVKLFKYPRIVGEAINVKLDLSGCKPAHFITAEGKAIRDALTHSSPYVDPKSGDYEKAARILYLTHLDAEQLYVAAVDYAIEVETVLHQDPRQTAPWLYTEGGGEALSTALKQTVIAQPTYFIFP